MEIPRIKLKSGNSIPVLGLGTWQLTGSKGADSVRKALELGYNHIDTAEVYDNHREVGRSIVGFDRSELWITSKVWRDVLRHDDLHKACDKALSALGIDYMDLYLIHWPNPEIAMAETLKALKELQDMDKIRSIGVSNFTIRHLKEAFETGVPISVNQVEFHPHLYQKELLDFCKQNNIIITAYSPLGTGAILKDETIAQIAEKTSRTPAQVALKWLLGKGLVVIPKASSEEHLKQNLSVFDWELSGQDIKAIDSIGVKHRIYDEFDNFDE